MPWISDQERQGRGDRMNKWIRLERKLWIRYHSTQSSASLPNMINCYLMGVKRAIHVQKRIQISELISHNIVTETKIQIFQLDFISHNILTETKKYFNYPISHNILTETGPLPTESYNQSALHRSRGSDRSIFLTDLVLEH